MNRKARLLNVIAVLALLASLPVAYAQASAITKGGQERALASTASSKMYLPIVTRSYRPAGIGSIRFTVDRPASRTAIFPGDGSAVSVAATDRLGFVWELTVPGDALIVSRTITMTPFSTIDSTAAPGDLDSGVLLEPEELRFLSPVTLTVSVPITYSTTGIMVSSAGDGTRLSFADATRAGRVYAASIWHFSGAGWSHGPRPWDMQGWTDAAQAEYNRAKAAAEQLLKTPVAAPPPPSISPQCLDNQAAAEKQIEDYVAGFLEPETQTASELMAVSKALVLLGQPEPPDAMPTARSVASRLVQKAHYLLVFYGSSPDKFLAGAQAVMKASRQLVLLEGAEDPDLLVGAAAWALNARDFYLNQLRNQHDYRLFRGLLYLQRTIILLGAPDDSATFFQTLAQAMTFKIVLDDTMTLAVAGYTGDAFVTHGEITLTPTPGTWKWEGTQTFNYVSGYHSLWTLVLPLTWSATVKIENFDPCDAGTLDIITRPFGALDETFVAQNLPTLHMSGLSTGIAVLAFQSHNTGEGWKFTMPINNLQATAGDHTFDEHNYQGSGDYHAALHIQVIHTPQ